MRSALSVAAGLAMFLQASGQPFAGTWIADHQGKPLVRLEVQSAGNTLTGWIQLADIHVDKNGEVETVTSGLSARTPLVDVGVRNRVLAFGRGDGDDIDRFELMVNDAGRAELRFILTEAERQELADDGIPPPKPFRLMKVAR